MINNFWTFADRELAGRKRIRGLKFNVVSLAVVGLLGLSPMQPPTMLMRPVRRWRDE